MTLAFNNGGERISGDRPDLDRAILRQRQSASNWIPILQSKITFRKLSALADGRLTRWQSDEKKLSEQETQKLH